MLAYGSKTRRDETPLKIVLFPSLERGYSICTAANRPATKRALRVRSGVFQVGASFLQQLLKAIFMMRMPGSRLREFRRDVDPYRAYMQPSIEAGCRRPHNLSSVLSERLFEGPVIYISIRC
jgi:hypothetical protein